MLTTTLLLFLDLKYSLIIVCLLRSGFLGFLTMDLSLLLDLEMVQS